MNPCKSCRARRGAVWAAAAARRSGRRSPTEATPLWGAPGVISATRTGKAPSRGGSRCSSEPLRLLPLQQLLLSRDQPLALLAPREALALRSPAARGRSQTASRLESAAWRLPELLPQSVRKKSRRLPLATARALAAVPASLARATPGWGSMRGGGGEGWAAFPLDAAGDTGFSRAPPKRRATKFPAPFGFKVQARSLPKPAPLPASAVAAASPTLLRRPGQLYAKRREERAVPLLSFSSGYQLKETAEVGTILLDWYEALLEEWPGIATQDPWQRWTSDITRRLERWTRILLCDIAHQPARGVPRVPSGGKVLAEAVKITLDANGEKVGEGKTSGCDARRLLYVTLEAVVLARVSPLSESFVEMYLLVELIQWKEIHKPLFQVWSGMQKRKGSASHAYLHSACLQILFKVLWLNRVSRVADATWNYNQARQRGGKGEYAKTLTYNFSAAP